MSYEYSPELHRDCYKLRVLMNNYCNLNCSYCLNDFQPKYPLRSIDIPKLLPIVTEYLEFMGESAEIYLSGGEPTQHPEFSRLVKEISALRPPKFVLCSNGIDKTGLEHLFTEIHYSAHVVTKSFVQELIERHPFVTINFMYGSASDERLIDLVVPGVRFKVWADLFRSSDQEYMTAFNAFLDKTQGVFYHRGRDFHPVNRGALCQGCTKSCVTLKGLWVFPDGRTSACPQSPDRHDSVSQGFELHKFQNH